jgi:hypothetical protein
LDLLYEKSETARGLMDAAIARQVSITIIQIVPDLRIGQANNRFNPATGEITWDPFVYVRGVNTDGTPYTLTPIELLAHEFVHAAFRENPAYQTPDSEPLVMSIANQIAAELNAAMGTNYSTDRNNHERTGQFYSSSVTSADLSIARPACN